MGYTIYCSPISTKTSLSHILKRGWKIMTAMRSPVQPDVMLVSMSRQKGTKLQRIIVKIPYFHGFANVTQRRQSPTRAIARPACSSKDSLKKQLTGDCHLPPKLKAIESDLTRFGKVGSNAVKKQQDPAEGHPLQRGSTLVQSPLNASP